VSIYKPEVKVLIVEDDLINLLVAKKLLETHFTVSTASKVKDALEIVEIEKFDIILMDINLGDDEMDGIKVMKRIRSMPLSYAQKIYAVTSYAMPEDKQRFLQEGFDYYFAKPINKELIVERILSELN
jgi:CheY-like chemotaxis protein